VNTLCDTSMMAAFGQDRDIVTIADVNAAVEEMQWIEYAERSVKLQVLPPLVPQVPDATGERRLVLGRILVGVNGATIAERELSVGRFIIGRTSDNDLQVDSKFVSRHHAQIITTAQSCVIEDLNSTNGIHVRSKRVRRRILNDGDVVQIGQHEIMYFDERLSRTRVLPNDGEDDAVPMPRNAASAVDAEDEDEDQDSVGARGH
jgi:hypothetical protein